MIRTIGNILWFVLAGFWMALGYLIWGIALLITIIGIPFGIQAFKMAQFVWWPFGKTIVQVREGPFVVMLNIIWIIVAGLWLAIGHVLAGLLLCITIIGIPFGLVSFRLAGLSLTPFGRKVFDHGEVPAGANTVADFAPRDPKPA